MAPVGPVAPGGIVNANTLAVFGPLEAIASGPLATVGVPNPAEAPVGPVAPCGIVNAKTFAVLGPLLDMAKGPLLTLGVPNPAAAPSEPSVPSLPEGPVAPVFPLGIVKLKILIQVMILMMSFNSNII